MDEGNELERFVNLRDHWRGLGAELGNGAATFDLGSGGRECTSCRTGPLGHGALRARMLALKTERRPDNGVELEEEKQGQDQAHAELYL
ncbi:MAG: hypothetical protein H0X69_11915 [Gemmatimonadales bacterium]|nr:hypothetical protein [Gemmatimonadales bacterium]